MRGDILPSYSTTLKPQMGPMVVPAYGTSMSSFLGSIARLSQPDLGWDFFPFTLSPSWRRARGLLLWPRYAPWLHERLNILSPLGLADICHINPLAPPSHGAARALRGTSRGVGPNWVFEVAYEQGCQNGRGHRLSSLGKRTR